MIEQVNRVTLHKDAWIEPSSRLGLFLLNAPLNSNADGRKFEFFN